MRLYKYFFKRLIDILISTFLISILLPFLLIISILIKLNSKGNIFFLQERLGKNGKVFKIYKFRTMTDKPRKVRQVLLNDDEVTYIGKFLRRYKIDELPQLINIFKGNMSMVGPRPDHPSHLKNYNEIAKARLSVLPGLTGLSQINGNIHISWGERWQFDKKYVDNLSFYNDMKIILKTFLVVILGEEKFKKS